MRITWVFAAVGGDRPGISTEGSGETNGVEYVGAVAVSVGNAAY